MEHGRSRAHERINEGQRHDAECAGQRSPLRRGDVFLPDPGFRATPLRRNRAPEALETSKKADGVVLADVRLVHEHMAPFQLFRPTGVGAGLAVERESVLGSLSPSQTKGRRPIFRKLLAAAAGPHDSCDSKKGGAHH